MRLLAALALLLAAGTSASAEGLSVAFIADAFDDKPAPALAALRALAPAGVFLIGDLPHRNPGGNCNNAAGCLAKMRLMYDDLYGAATPLGADFTREILDGGVPVLGRILDDHDSARDNVSNNFPYWPEVLQAFGEYHALPADNGLALGYMYQSVQVGPALFVLLDLRSHRETDPGVRHTILGLEQKAWLLARLSAAAIDPTVTWTVLVSTVPFNPNQQKLDSWSGYPVDRQWLLDLLATTGLRNVLVVSGDCHFGSIALPPLSPLPELNIPKLNEGFGNTCNNNDHQWTLNSEQGGTGFGLLKLKASKAVMRIYNADGTQRLRVTVPVQ